MIAFLPQAPCWACRRVYFENLWEEYLNTKAQKSKVQRVLRHKGLTPLVLDKTLIQTCCCSHFT
jgi:hypothetical protein